MKGSPILASFITILIMSCMYVGARILILGDSPQQSVSEDTIHKESNTHTLSTYAELYFSQVPESFQFTDPINGKVIIEQNDLEESEWSGDIQLPIQSSKIESHIEVELIGTIRWKESSNHYHFMQVVISPDSLESKSATLRSSGNISDVLYFKWKKNESDK